MTYKLLGVTDYKILTVIRFLKPTAAVEGFEEVVMNYSRTLRKA